MADKGIFIAAALSVDDSKAGYEKQDDDDEPYDYANVVSERSAVSFHNDYELR
jgi:hypothetical protein